MKYGILGDIHSNLSALEVAVAGLREEAVDVFISVGDVVGYGAAPSECIRILRDIEAVVVLGNHDAACAGIMDPNTFNPHAREAVAWTQSALGPEELAWLESLPMTAELEHCQVAHGTLQSPEQYDYVLGTGDAEPSLDVMTRRVCFVGHSHIPISFLRFADDPGRTAYTLDTMIDLAEVERALVNVGSVGQPRDEDPRTAFVVYDSDADRVWFRRAEYDVDREMARILDAGLPTILAQRLPLGI